MDEEGMINVWVDLQKHLSSISFDQDENKDVKERGIDQKDFDKCPPLNIVIFIVGSRGQSISPGSQQVELISVRRRTAIFVFGTSLDRIPFSPSQGSDPPRLQRLCPRRQ
jgi:hypothetical protein